MSRSTPPEPPGATRLAEGLTAPRPDPAPGRAAVHGAVPAVRTAKPAAGLAATNARRWLWLAVSVGVLAVVCLLSIVIGTKNLSPATVWGAFAHYTGTSDQSIVRDLRVPV